MGPVRCPMGFAWSVGGHNCVPLPKLQPTSSEMAGTMPPEVERSRGGATGGASSAFGLFGLLKALFPPKQPQPVCVQ